MKRIKLIHIAGNIGIVILCSIFVIPFLFLGLLPDITSFYKGDHSQTVSIFLGGNSDFKVHFTQSSVGHDFVHLSIKEIGFDADFIVKNSRTRKALIGAKDARLLYNTNSKVIDKVFLTGEHKKIRIDFRQDLNRYYEQNKSNPQLSNIFKKIEEKEKRKAIIMIAIAFLICFILPSAAYWYEILVKERSISAAIRSKANKNPATQEKTSKGTKCITAILLLFIVVPFYFSLYYPLVVNDDKYMVCSMLYGVFLILWGAYCFRLTIKGYIGFTFTSPKLKCFAVSTLFIFISISSYFVITNALPRFLHIFSSKEDFIMTVLPKQRISHYGCRYGFLFDRGKLFRISSKELCNIDRNIYFSIKWGDKFILYGKKSIFGFHMDRYDIIRKK